MKYSEFKQNLNKLGFTAENLEPNELDVISLDKKQTVSDGNFPKEFAYVYLDHVHQFFVGHLISDKLFLLVKHFADTSIKDRHIPKHTLYNE